MARGRRTAAVLTALCAVLLSVVAGCSNAPPSVHIGTTALGKQPNIVFVLTDDLSTDLLPYLPHVLAMQRMGTSFSNYTVTDSFCCPSRSSILTGNYPHDTGVFTNEGPDGGFHIFHERGEENHTFGTALQSVGYRTAFMGKYLNGYNPTRQFGSDGEPQPGDHTWVPPGWDEWDVSGTAYSEYNYWLNENHHIQHYGDQPEDYLTDVLSAKGQAFIRSSALVRKPFFLELATYAPHLPATPAPQDLASYPDIQAPHDGSWDRVPTNAPHWLQGKHVSPKDVPGLNRVFRNQVLAVQSVDRMLGDLEETLRQTGTASNTLVVFSSDNGFHIGSHGLYPGKLSAFDTDVRVPLVVTGPHVAAGQISDRLVQNIDLAPTFEQIGGATVEPSVDGRSFVPLLLGKSVPWRTFGLIEHHGGEQLPGDPDLQRPRGGNPPLYEALRTNRFTYVQYGTGEREYYDRVDDPFEVYNTYDQLSPAQVAALNRRVDLLQNCHDGAQCWSAGGPSTE